MTPKEAQAYSPGIYANGRHAYMMSGDIGRNPYGSMPGAEARKMSDCWCAGFIVEEKAAKVRKALGQIRNEARTEQDTVTASDMAGAMDLLSVETLARLHDLLINHDTAAGAVAELQRES